MSCALRVCWNISVNRVSNPCYSTIYDESKEAVLEGKGLILQGLLHLLLL